MGWSDRDRGHKHGHGHGHGHAQDPALATSRRGLRALWLSFGVLMATALAQAVLVILTGSVALLGDTLHNLADALTAVPLAIAFVLGRRAASARFPSGLGRAEDLAGLVVLVVIAASAASTAWWAIARLADPREVEHLWVLGAAGLLGFAGNEWVARYRIRVGREIGSAALVADGLHARADGFTSLAVVASALLSALGWTRADPLVGLGITLAIVAVLVVSAREVLGRMLDGVDAADVHTADATLRVVDGVRDVADLRLRWVGHELHAQAQLAVDGRLSLIEAHRIAHEAEHRLVHALPRLRHVTLHVHPFGSAAEPAHGLIQHHYGGPPVHGPDH